MSISSKWNSEGLNGKWITITQDEAVPAFLRFQNELYAYQNNFVLSKQ